MPPWIKLIHLFSSLKGTDEDTLVLTGWGFGTDANCQNEITIGDSDSGLFKCDVSTVNADGTEAKCQVSDSRIVCPKSEV